MSYSAYQSTVPAFIAMLRNMSAWLDKAAAQKDEAVLIDARLTPDMFPLSRQIQIASAITALIAGTSRASAAALTRPAALRGSMPARNSASQT